MKLVDILARELKVWPDHMTHLWVSSGNTIYGKNGLFEFEMNGGWDKPEDHRTVSVSRAEWQAAVDALNAPKVVAWDGVGLPPVGLDVEIKRGNCTWIDGDEWQIGKTATVMASFLNSRDIKMASVQFPGGHCECILARCLSPIRTAEQVAAEEREKEIADMMEVTSDGITCMDRDDALALYKAGYRKQVAK